MKVKITFDISKEEQEGLGRSFLGQNRPATRQEIINHIERLVETSFMDIVVDAANEEEKKAEKDMQ